MVEITTTSDAEGIYRFNNVTPGDYTLIITLPEGYSHSGPAQQPINVSAGETTTAPSTPVEPDEPEEVDDKLFLPSAHRP